MTEVHLRDEEKRFVLLPIRNEKLWGNLQGTAKRHLDDRGD